MDFSQEELKIKTEADAFANEHKDKIAKEATDVSIFLPEINPVSVFMAGSPGAGKTESSKNLIKKFSVNGRQIIRLEFCSSERTFRGKKNRERTFY